MPRGSLTIPVKIGTWFRLAALGASFLCLLVTLGLLAAAAGLAAAGAPAGSAVFALLGAVSIWPLVNRLRRLFSRRAHLVLTDDHLVITHPGVLASPTRIARTGIRVANLDTARKGGRFAVRADFRFSAPGDEQPVRGYLCARPGRGLMSSPFPMLGHDAQRPNLVLVFTESVTLEPHRHWQRVRSHRPRFESLRRPTRALLLEVADAAAAASAFERWDILRGLVDSDFDEARATAPMPATAAEVPRPATDPLDVQPPTSIRARAALAISLTIGFYVLAASIAIACLVDAARAIATGDPALWDLGFGAVGISLVWSLVPRPVAVERDGVLAAPSSQPRLWTLVREVAATIGEDPPDEVRIIGAENAGVYETGGPWNRRVLAIGLSLLAALTVDEIRAVLAHELAHFQGGDTRLTRRVATTNRSIINTIRRLSKARDWLLRGGSSGRYSSPTIASTSA